MRIKCFPAVGCYVAQRPDQIRAVFGDNLTELAKSERSVADLARKLGMNRTQLLRFMAGTAFPRPDVLQQICDHFQVDARIFTTPLSELGQADATYDTGLDRYFEDVFTTVPENLLPDGHYLEWLANLTSPGMLNCYPLTIVSERGRRFTKLTVHYPVVPIRKMAKSGDPAKAIPPIESSYEFLGQIFAQRGGFAIIDRAPMQKRVALTAYQFGYIAHDEIYPGYKLAGASYSAKLIHSHCACVLQRLPNDAAVIAAAQEQPTMRPFEEAPMLIQTVLNELNRENHAYLWPHLKELPIG